ncbi:hypothetical protein AncyloWKF20_07570 [Ancylobacter sp. WKF20]|uniref:hypothetical protein n=1 Tax=Ancylobacter sp. WKF20 TaxID=3039801 RepID=UPI0024343BA3|nr:hypothetical protein [Ancylobacter sp. WKF20]WGD31668.1 hypothetical protein AncyloWKF20_07570 [Ancylobacter sp. WKF20]
MKAGAVLYDPVKGRFKGHPGYARGWSGRLAHAEIYATPEEARAVVPGALNRLKVLNVYLVEEDIDHALEPLTD